MLQDEMYIREDQEKDSTIESIATAFEYGLFVDVIRPAIFCSIYADIILIDMLLVFHSPNRTLSITRESEDEPFKFVLQSGNKMFLIFYTPSNSPDIPSILEIGSNKDTPETILFVIDDASKTFEMEETIYRSEGSQPFAVINHVMTFDRLKGMTHTLDQVLAHVQPCCDTTVTKPLQHQPIPYPHSASINLVYDREAHMELAGYFSKLPSATKIDIHFLARELGFRAQTIRFFYRINLAWFKKNHISIIDNDYDEALSTRHVGIRSSTINTH